MDAGHIEAILHKGYSLYGLKKFDESIEYLNKYLEKHTDQALPYYYLGLNYS